jgi:predicted RNA binding protein YcfA (HicA-like mRNA interferase family)
LRARHAFCVDRADAICAVCTDIIGQTMQTQGGRWPPFFVCRARKRPCPLVLREAATQIRFGFRACAGMSEVPSALRFLRKMQPLASKRGNRLASVWGLAMKVREVIRLLDEDRWFLVATRGSHRQFRHAEKPGRVTVAGKPSDDLAPGTLASIFKQAGLKGTK